MTNWASVPDSLGGVTFFGGVALAAGIGIGVLDRKWFESGNVLVRAVGSGVLLVVAVATGEPSVIEIVATALIGYWPVRLDMWTRTGLWK